MILRCKMCGGELGILEDGQLAVCIYCGTKQTIPKLDDERRLNMFEMANHHRRNSDYDKAMGLFEAVLNEDRTDAEAYWSILLCKYGVVYVEDPATRKRILTCNRTLHRSIMVDEDYKATLQYANAFSKELYVKEAEIIDDIQKRAMDISLREKPYDIFISYKESDNQGRRTYDSLFAQDIYQQLTQVGYKVFYSRVSLEDKTGLEYEPYIFAALSSAKVMLVIGTNSENINAPWVKNEWSRFLVMKSENPEKQMFPVFRDMKAEDLPAEFKFLQAQDMGKIGAMQDLLRGLEKVLKVSKQLEPATRQLQAGENINIENLLRRIEAFLQEGDIKKAKEYCEKVLDIKIDEARVYIAQLRMALADKYEDVTLRSEEELIKLRENISTNPYFQKAMSYAQGEYLEKLRSMKRSNEAFCYQCAMEAFNNAEAFDYNEVINFAEQFLGQAEEKDWKSLQEQAEEIKKKQELIKGKITGLEAEVTEMQQKRHSIGAKINALRKEQKAAKTELENYFKEIELSEQGIKACELEIKEVKKSKWTSIYALGVLVVLLCFSLAIDSGFAMICGLGIVVVFFFIMKFWTTEFYYKNDISREKNDIKETSIKREKQKEVVDDLEREIGKQSLEISKLSTAIEKGKEEIKALMQELPGNRPEATEEGNRIGMTAYVCEVCGKVYSTKGKPYKCVECNAAAAEIVKKTFDGQVWR